MHDHTIEQTPLISICIPVYNAAKYLEQALNRILGQGYSNIEVIIVDNCSTDGSESIAKRFTEQDARVRFYQNTWNIGYSGNVYKATSLAVGDFILFHAADDLMESDALQSYVDVIIAQGEVDKSRLLILSDFYVIDEKDVKDKVRYFDPSKFSLEAAEIDEYKPFDVVITLSGNDIIKPYFSALKCFGWVGTVMFSKELYDRVEGYINNHWINPDKFFMYKILSLDPAICWLRQPLFCYRIHDTNQNSQQARMGVIKYLLDEYAFTFEFTSDFYNKNSYGKEELVHFFVEHDCLDSALVKMANKERVLGFRYLSFALATYPDIAWKSPKTYLAIIIWLLGPIGSFIAGSFYKSGFWQKFLRKSA